MTRELVKGSILEKKEKSGKSLPEVLAEIEGIVVVDGSGSMNSTDGKEKTRHKRAQDELNELQKRFPAKLALIEFSYEAKLVPSGVLEFPGGGTQYLSPLGKLKDVDSMGLKFFFISDGEPNEEESSIYDFLIKAKFKTPLNTVYIGPEGGDGEKVLRRMASLTGGKHFTFGVNFEFLLSNEISQLMIAGT